MRKLVDEARQRIVRARRHSEAGAWPVRAYPPPVRGSTDGRPGDIARLYHRLSSYSYLPGDAWPEPIDHPLVRQDFEPNHLPTFPAPTKAYPADLPSAALPGRWPTAALSCTAVLAGRAPRLTSGAPGSLDPAGLARLLYLSAGVTRVVPRRDGFKRRRGDARFREAGA